MRDQRQLSLGRAIQPKACCSTRGFRWRFRPKRNSYIPVAIKISITINATFDTTQSSNTTNIVASSGTKATGKSQGTTGKQPLRRQRW